MKRSVFKLANDFFIGKYVEFYIEARHIGDEISRLHESDGKTKELTSRKTKYGDYQFIDEKIIDKIIQVELKNRTWIFHTLEGYQLKRNHWEDLNIVEHNLEENIQMSSSPTLKQTIKLEEDLVDINVAAEITGYEKSYLYELKFRKKIPFIQRSKRGLVRFSRRALKEWMESKTD
jgi:excisionase family DNA binding protein